MPIPAAWSPKLLSILRIVVGLALATAAGCLKSVGGAWGADAARGAP